MFAFSRRSSIGLSVPTWLSNPGPVLLKRHVKTSKHEPLVDEVELVHTTPSYAHVRLQDGRETTVSLKDIAPVGRDHEEIDAEAPSTSVASDSSINKDSHKNDESEKVQDSADSCKKTVEQACTTYGPRATCGPRDLFLRPARTQLQKMLQKPDFG